MRDFQERLLSRKWILALGTVCFFALNRQYDQIAQVVIAYLAIQAGVDAFQTYSESKEAQ